MRMFAPALLLAVLACTPGESRQSTVYSDSAGIRIAVNDPRNPAWSRTEVWVLANPPRLQVGNVPGDPAHDLYRVAHARRLRDGRIAVANTGVGDVRVYGSDGELLQTIALSDTGGSVPVRVAQLRGDSLLIVTIDGSLLIYDRDGEQVARSRLATPPGSLPGEPEIVGTFRDGTLLVRARHPDDPAKTGAGHTQVRLLRYAPNGQPLGSFGDFGDEATLFAERGDYIFGPTAVYTASDSTIWYSSADRYEVREIAVGGRTLRIIRLDRPGNRVMQTDIFAYRQAAKRQSSGTPAAATIDATLEASVFADTFPAYDRVLLDDVGDVWLRNYRFFDLGTGHGWNVFDPAGRYLGEVRTPSRLEVHQIGADFLLGRLSNQRGLEAVYMWMLEKPGTAGATSASRS